MQKISNKAIDRHVLYTYKRSRNYKSAYWKAVNRLWERNKLKRKFVLVENEDEIYEVQ